MPATKVLLPASDVVPCTIKTAARRGELTASVLIAGVLIAGVLTTGVSAVSSALAQAVLSVFGEDIGLKGLF